jgi:hypothetical protein
MHCGGAFRLRLGPPSERVEQAIDAVPAGDPLEAALTAAVTAENPAAFLLAERAGTNGRPAEDS